VCHQCVCRVSCVNGVLARLRRCTHSLIVSLCCGGVGGWLEVVVRAECACVRGCRHDAVATLHSSLCVCVCGPRRFFAFNNELSGSIPTAVGSMVALA
jgi:hypothetical protein